MFSAKLALFRTRESGCFREVAVLYSDHYEAASLYMSVQYGDMLPRVVPQLPRLLPAPPNPLPHPQVRKPDMSWHDAKKALKRDVRWEVVEASVESAERESMFQSHIRAMNEKKRIAFRKLLDETSQVLHMCSTSPRRWHLNVLEWMNGVHLIDPCIRMLSTQFNSLNDLFL